MHVLYYVVHIFHDYLYKEKMTVAPLSMSVFASVETVWLVATCSSENSSYI